MSRSVLIKNAMEEKHAVSLGLLTWNPNRQSSLYHGLDQLREFFAKYLV